MMTIQKSRTFNALTPVILFCFVLSALSYAQEIQIVAPNGLENSRGNSDGRIPTAPRRVQVLYDAEHLASDGVIEITSLAWRSDESQTSPFSSTDAEMFIRFSTTERPFLTTDFEFNIGADELEVYKGPVTLGHSDEMQATDFLQSIDFTRPFRYDPSAGNLLVDYWFTGFSPQWTIDHQEFSDGKTRMILDSPDSSTATAFWNLVPVTQFTAVPVPEPTGLSLAAIAGFIIPCAVRRRRRRQDR